jgi:hypothetical protein
MDRLTGRACELYRRAGVRCEQAGATQIYVPLRGTVARGYLWVCAEHAEQILSDAEAERALGEPAAWTPATTRPPAG